MKKDLLHHLSVTPRPMKSATLAILSEVLKEYNTTIKEHEESLQVGKALLGTGQFTQDGIDVIRGKLSAFNKSKLEVLACIKWIKSIK